MLRLCLAVCSLLLLQAGSAWSHGTQIQITNTGNKIVTRNALTDVYSPISDPIRVYQMPLVLDVSGQTFTYPTMTQPLANSGPGFAFGTGGFFDSGTISLNLLEGLKVWNGAAFIDPGLEQINVFRGSVTATTPSIQMTTADAGPITSIVVSAAATMPIGAERLGDSFHTSVRYRMLGDGTSRTALGDDGVYLLQFSLSSTQAGLDASDPFFFLLDKNSGAVELSAASNYLLTSNGFSASQLQAIPEPGTWALCAGLIPLALWSYRRNKAGKTPCAG